MIVLSNALQWNAEQQMFSSDSIFSSLLLFFFFLHKVMACFGIVAMCGFFFNYMFIRQYHIVSVVADSGGRQF